MQNLCNTPPKRPPPLSSTPFSTPINPPPQVSSKSCLPRPLFQEEPETLSTKKERKGPLFRPPPRPPAKSCPPKSRVFRRTSDLLKAQVVSFNQGRELTGTPLHSVAYDTAKAGSYFEQAFIKEKEIGAGYFGTVYRVRSRDDEKLYAVKIARDRYRGPTDRTRKLEEVRKHQFLPPHSNLVKFHHSWEDKGRLYQQFELCQANLQGFVDRESSSGCLEQGMVWDFLVDLLQAVGHLHDHDLVHMDIKPENIFIGMDGICKLGDFGLMIDLASGEEEGMEGDPKYLAPEVLQGSFTKACDVFSLGVTMLEVACDLDLPKAGPLWHQLRKSGPDPELSLHLQPELRRVLQLMMTRDADRRPSIRQILDLPSVASAARRRARQLAVTRFWTVFCRLAAGLVHLLLHLVSLVLPLKDLLPHTSPPPTTPPPLPSAASIDAFSDDDEVDCTIDTESSRGSELAAPLSSSSGSLHDTTPPPRHRTRCIARTPGVSPGKRLDFNDAAALAEVGGLRFDELETSFRVNRDTTRDSSGEECVSSDEEGGKVRPKSLANSFDHFSADDD